MNTALGGKHCVSKVYVKEYTRMLRNSCMQIPHIQFPLRTAPPPTLPHDVSLCGKIYGRDLKFTIAFNLGFEEPLGHPPPPQLSQDEVVCPFLLTDISPRIVALAGEMK